MGIKAPSWVFLQSRHLGLSPKPLHYTKIVTINHCFQIEDLGSLEDCGCGNLGDVTWVMIRLDWGCSIVFGEGFVHALGEPAPTLVPW
jgi:hypothetical protein